MTLGGQAYMQVGNETYSLMVTEEDMEKRRTERERQKRLSQETNRRRKALEDRKKLAVEREARKRSLELSKRRQRQTEATERYQRSHIGLKHDKRAKFHGGIKPVPSLDNVLQQLRSGSTEISYPYQLNSASPEVSSQLTEHVKSQFEMELEEQKQKFLEHHKQQTMQEFTNELKAETVPAPATRPYNETMYNVNANSFLTYQQQETPNSNFQYSNVDIMSGRAVNSMDQVQGAPGLAGSLSRLFIGQEQHLNERGEPAQFEEEERDQLSAKTDTLIPSYGRSHKEKVRTYQTNKTKVEDSLDTGLDDQDSLHGSNDPVASPVFNNHLTSFQRKYFADVETALKQNTPVNSPNSYRVSGYNNQEPKPTESKQIENQTTTYYSANSSPSITRAPPNYYVKSYRPWSTTEPSNDVSDWSKAKPVTTRPMSAAPTIQTAPQTKDESSKQSLVSSQIEQPASKPWSAPVMHVSIPTSMQFVSNYATTTTTQPTVVQQTVKEEVVKREPINNHWMTQTTATPISTFLSKTQSPMPDSIPNKQPVLSRQSSIQKQKPAASVLTEASPLPMPTDRQKVSFSPAPDEKTVAESTPIKDKAETPEKVRSILRKVSKYGGKSTYPLYHAAGVVARNQWVDHVNNSPYQTANAKLKNTEVRDSLEAKKIEEKKERKSVKWNEIQYNDGTSVSIATPGLIVKPEIPVSPAPVVKQVSPRGKSPKGKQGKSKGKPAAASSPKGGKKGGKQGRKFKPAKEVVLPMEPRPPTTKKKQLVMATAINYSVPSGDYSESNESPTNNNQNQRHVSWTTKEQDVTMDTLKSSGSSENLDFSPTVGSTVRNGNQVTIHMMKPDVSNGKTTAEDEGQQPSLDKTPTDQEISWLWDKVRSCLAQRPSSRVQQPNNLLRKTASDTNRFGGAGRRSAWNAAVAPTIQQQQASIVSIDGGLLSPDNMLVKPTRNRRLVRPTSVQLSNKAPNSANDSYGAFMRRQALLQQRRHKHYMSRGVKPDMMRTFSNYPSPKPSYNAPLPSPSSASGREHMSDSTTAFLLAETLAEQNLSEDQIIHAMDSLQKRTRDAQKHGKQVMASALSTEEQRLLASLERLNTRLREVEETVSKNPQSSSGPFFSGPQHQIPVYKHQNQRSVSADARYQRSRLRY